MNDLGTEDSPQKSEIEEYTIENIIEGEVSLEDFSINELLDIHLELVRKKNRIRDILLNGGKIYLR